MVESNCMAMSYKGDVNTMQVSFHTQRNSESVGPARSVNICISRPSSSNVFPISENMVTVRSSGFMTLFIDLSKHLFNSHNPILDDLQVTLHNEGS